MTRMRETVGGVEITIRGEAVDGVSEAVDRILEARVPERMRARDPQLWDPAEPGTAERAAWLDAPAAAADVARRVHRLADERADLDRVVLLGMGGSSLAAEVVARTAGRRLTVLDTTDCVQTARSLAKGPERTLLVVSSKSGETLETDCQFRIHLRALRRAGLSGPELARHIVAVTDPGSVLAVQAEELGCEVFLNDPLVGGRFSALTGFGLVASGLVGARLDELVEDATLMDEALRKPEASPGVLLGAVLAAAARRGRDKLALCGHSPGLVGFGDWLEQLVAESSGKDGRGILPFSCLPPVLEDRLGPDALHVALSARPRPYRDGGDPHLEVTGPLGAQFLLWEYAIAVACWELGVNPFDQPNVEEAKANALALLHADTADPADAQQPEPTFTDGPVQVYLNPNSPGLSTGTRTLRSLFAALVKQIPDRGYLSVLAYLDRIGDAPAAGLRPLLQACTDRPVTFGWGPRFLHSTGQYHKGGPQHGVFCQITAEATDDLDVPGRPWTLATIQRAQSAGDLQALRRRHRPALRLHLRDREAGIAHLLESAAACDRP